VDNNEVQILRAIKQRAADGLDLLPHQVRWLISQAELIDGEKQAKDAKTKHDADVGNWT